MGFLDRLWNYEDIVATKENPVWNDNVTGDPSEVPDWTSDVPGSYGNKQQTLFQRWWYGDSTYTPSRDASSPPPVNAVTRDTGAEGTTGILGRMWNAIIHPLQTVEDTGASTGTAIGKGVGNAVSGIVNSLLPLLIIGFAVILIALYIVAQRTSIRANL